jgi:hypothetical protein
MAAYEAALTGPRTAIGAGRIKPGSVAAVVAEYLDSQQFFGSKSAGTQRMRRGILERFRAAWRSCAPVPEIHRAGRYAPPSREPHPARPQSLPPRDELAALELELVWARLCQVRSEIRQANAFWFWFYFKKAMFWAAVLWVLSVLFR